MDFKHLVVPKSYNRFNLFQFEFKLGSRSKSRDTSSHWTFCDSMLASSFHACCLPLPCLVISFTRISRGPSHYKSGSLNNKYHSTSQSKSTEITCQCTNPFHHLARATPKTTRKFRGHGRVCWPRPAWPPQRSAARPWRHGLSQPRIAAPWSLGRRGCDAEEAAAAAPRRNKA